MKAYWGTSDVADLFGVTRATVNQWMKRYSRTAMVDVPEETRELLVFPEPDVMAGGAYGWDPSRKSEFRRWMDRRNEYSRESWARAPHPRRSEAYRSTVSTGVEA